MRFVFLVIPFTISFGFHSLILYRFSSLLSCPIRWYAWPLIALLTFNLFLVFGLMVSGVWNEAIRGWLVVNYIYFGIIFFAFWICLFHFLIWWIMPPFRHLPLPWHLVMLLGVIGIGVVWGLIQAWRPQVKTIEIQSQKVQEPIKLVQLTDLHIGTTYGAAYVRNLVEKVNNLKPDAVLITGDVFDHGIKDAQIAAFNDFQVPVYFIWGNHETYFGLRQAQDMLTKTPLQLLINQTVNLRPWLHITGMDYMEHNPGKDPKKALESITWDKDAFNLMLSHVPLDFPLLQPFPIDLELSGHTHAGQIWPFNWFVHLRYKQIKGLYQQGDQKIYVSPGTGTWGPPLRLGSQCEITEINLEPAS